MDNANSSIPCLPFWATVPRPVPEGGTIGQVLTKKSSLEGDYNWSDSTGGSLPSGGTTGQVLTKNSDTSGDATWKNTFTPLGIYVNDYILTVTNATAQEAKWAKPIVTSGVEADNGKILTWDNSTGQGKWENPKSNSWVLLTTVPVNKSPAQNWESGFVSVTLPTGYCENLLIIKLTNGKTYSVLSPIVTGSMMEMVDYIDSQPSPYAPYQNFIPMMGVRLYSGSNGYKVYNMYKGTDISNWNVSEVNWYIKG